MKLLRILYKSLLQDNGAASAIIYYKLNSGEGY